MVRLTGFRRTLFYWLICTNDILLVFLFQDLYMDISVQLSTFLIHIWFVVNEIYASQGFIRMILLLFSISYCCSFHCIVFMFLLDYWYFSMVMYSYRLLWIFPEQIGSFLSAFCIHTSSRFAVASAGYILTVSFQL